MLQELKLEDSIYSVAFSCDEKLIVIGSNEGTITLYRRHNKRYLWKKSHEGGLKRTQKKEGVADINELLKAYDLCNVSFRNITYEVYGCSLDTSLTTSLHPTTSLTREKESTHTKEPQKEALEKEQIKEGDYKVFKRITINSLVKATTFSPDNKTLLTGSSDGTVVLWDVEQGTEIKRFIGHTDFVSSLAFSANGKTILTGAHDNTVRLWCIETGNQLKEYKGHTRFINSVMFSPDGKTILTGAADGTARLWNVETEKQLHEFIIKYASIRLAAFRPDKKTILIVLRDLKDFKVKVWDMHTGNQLPEEFKLPDWSTIDSI